MLAVTCPPFQRQKDIVAVFNGLSGYDPAVLMTEDRVTVAVAQAQVCCDWVTGHMGCRLTTAPENIAQDDRQPGEHRRCHHCGASVHEFCLESHSMCFVYQQEDEPQEEFSGESPSLCQRCMESSGWVLGESRNLQFIKHAQACCQFHCLDALCLLGASYL